MRKQQAIEAMREGKRVRHHYFSREEWMTIQKGTNLIELEDGCTIFILDFFSHRSGPEWEQGYEIVEQPTNIKEHGDFKMYYDPIHKRHYWILGYFGGGPVDIANVLDVAKEYARQHKVPLSTIKVDKILTSRRYKHFKFIYSTIPQTKDPESTALDNVLNALSD